MLSCREKLARVRGTETSFLDLGVGIWLSTELQEKFRAGGQGRDQFFGFRGRNLVKY